jgi:hypothetical protein
LRPHKVVLAVLYAAAVLALLHYLAEGWDYYRTPLLERPHHPQFWSLKPGGSLGRAFGMVGTALMLVMLLYSVRKRSKPLRKAGPLSVWLDFHIFCGIVGPLLVILHSSFKVHGLVALSFWSMIAVALSGILGRYLYLQIPRTRAGDERTLADVEAEARALTGRLRELGLTDAMVATLDEIAAEPRWLHRRRRLRAFEREHGGRELVAAIEQKSALQRRIVRWHRLQELFHYWHVFHKPFAVIMYLFMIVHVTVVSLAGYGLG